MAKMTASITAFAPFSRAVVPLAALAAVASGCAVDSPSVGHAAVDLAYFTCAVQPVLMAECATPACHGNTARRMEILAPGRMRLADEYATVRATLTEDDIEFGIQPPLTLAETEFNFIQARGMVDTDGGVAASPLINRPLAIGAGGRYHAPNGDIFVSRQDPGFVVLSRWIQGASGADCP